MEDIKLLEMKAMNILESLRMVDQIAAETRAKLNSDEPIDINAVIHNFVVKGVKALDHAMNN